MPEWLRRFWEALQVVAFIVGLILAVIAPALLFWLLLGVAVVAGTREAAKRGRRG